MIIYAKPTFFLPHSQLSQRSISIDCCDQLFLVKEKEEKYFWILINDSFLLVLEHFLVQLRHCKRLIPHKKLLISKIRDPLC